MRSYDNIDYRYDHGAPQPEAIRRIATIVGVRPDADGLCYSLRFHAGGTGIDDRYAIRCSLREADWPLVVRQLRLIPCGEADRDPAWHEDLRWLLGAEDTADPVDALCRRFIHENRHDFQDAADARSTILFTYASDVNSWCAVWRSDGRLNVLGFEQG